MDVVGVAIIRRVARHDGLQRRWAPRRDLQAVEAGPRVARHPDGARAPRLRGDPCDRVAAVDRLLLGVLVRTEAARFAGATDVDADARVALAGKPAHLLLVARDRAVGQSVGAVFDDGGDGVLIGINGQPDLGVQSRPVGQWDPDGCANLDRVGKCGANLDRGEAHASTSTRPSSTRTGYAATRKEGSSMHSPVEASNSHPCHGQTTTVRSTSW